MRCSASASDLSAKLERVAVVRGEEEEAQRLGVHLLAARRAGAPRCRATCDIFAPSRSRKPQCIQYLRERLAARRLALGDLVLVVGEDRGPAPPPWMSKVSPEVLRAHRRALDVPARPALAPRAVPRRLARLGRLPEREVERLALLLARLHALARAQVVEVALGELGVRRVAGSPRSTRRPATRRRRPRAISFSMMRDDLRDVLAHLRRDVRLEQVQRLARPRGTPRRSAPPAPPRSSPVSCAALMILSSTSVKLRTYVTSKPR